VWYIGGMTDWTAREFEIDLSFLDEGEHNMIIWKDGMNAHRNPEDFKKEASVINRNSSLKIQMESGGGFIALIDND